MVCMYLENNNFDLPYPIFNKNLLYLKPNYYLVLLQHFLFQENTSHEKILKHP